MDIFFFLLGKILKKRRLHRPGSTFLYKWATKVCAAPKGMIFGLKKGIDFAQFGLEWSVVFKGTMGVY